MVKQQQCAFHAQKELITISWVRLRAPNAHQELTTRLQVNSSVTPALLDTHARQLRKLSASLEQLVNLKNRLALLAKPEHHNPTQEWTIASAVSLVRIKSKKAKQTVKPVPKGSNVQTNTNAQLLAHLGITKGTSGLAPDARNAKLKPSTTVELAKATKTSNVLLPPHHSSWPSLRSD